MSADEEYIVESILGRRERKGVTQYLIKWKDYPPSDNTWEPVANLNCESMIREFEAGMKREEEEEESRKLKEKEKEKSKVKDRKSGSTPRQGKARSAKFVEEDESSDSDHEVVRKPTPFKPTKKPRSSVSARKQPPPSTPESGSDADSCPLPSAPTRIKGLERGLELDKIIGATDIGGKLQFLVKWKDTSAETELIPSEIANDKMPQAVISFYEDRLTWHTVQPDKK